LYIITQNEVTMIIYEYFMAFDVRLMIVDCRLKIRMRCIRNERGLDPARRCNRRWYCEWRVIRHQAGCCLGKEFPSWKDFSFSLGGKRWDHFKTWWHYI